jgi:hypothetical protein
MSEMLKSREAVPKLWYYFEELLLIGHFFQFLSMYPTNSIASFFYFVAEMFFL